jgi:hypothetical protein
MKPNKVLLGYGAFVVPEVFSCVKTPTTHHALPT